MAELCFLVARFHVDHLPFAFYMYAVVRSSGAARGELLQFMEWVGAAAGTGRMELRLSTVWMVLRLLTTLVG